MKVKKNNINIICGFKRREFDFCLAVLKAVDKICF
jgi:hypothetical protein